MFEQVLRKMREKVRTRQYVMTLHAEEEMNDDNLSIFDVEHCILTGTIVERQRDVTTAEWKYRIAGETFGGSQAEVIAKLSVVDKLVIITVYLS
ncbi:MAG TPA: DUF4258 domain-containing protein [Chloroflexia bacterium]|jgi:hypothetical protein